MRRRWWWIVVVLVILGAPFAWYVGSPLFLNRVVNEALPTGTGTSTKDFPMSAGATLPEGMTTQQVEDAMVKASRVIASASDPMPTVTTATVVARATFTGRDDFHQGEGTATVHRVGKDRILRLDPFKVTNGPDLYVILTKHPAPKTRADVQEGYLKIAQLKGNLGSQNYTLDQRVRLEEYRAVVIYCMRFHVVFSTATLQTSQ